MSYPTPGEYQEAVQFPASAFSDPMLQDAEVEEDILGLPRAVTGAFAVVFTLRTRGARWAAKCFLTDVKDQQERYRAISRAVAAHSLPYFVDFDYQPDGIRVEGRAYPMLKMGWLDALPLNAFIDRRRDDPEALVELLGRWREMMGRLEEAGIAHGDLQHGNVLVAGGELRLVDYDTMFVPALHRKKSPEVGHRNYQHPDRDEQDFGPHIDRFSALAVDTALQACIRDPELWDRFDTGENVLFRSEDFAAPRESALFASLRTLDDLRPQVEALERACFLEPNRVPPLSEVVGDAGSVPTVRRSRHAPERDGRRRDTFEAGFVVAAAAVTAIVLAVGAFKSAAVAVGLLAVSVSVGWIAAWTRHRRLPSVRRLRRLQQEDVYFERLLAGLQDELRRLKARRDEFAAGQESRYAERLEELKQEALDDRLKHHFVGEARGFDGLTHKAVVRLKAAGIRTASHATPENVGAVTRLSDASKARVNLWRSTLAARYEDDVPEMLSPAQERRVKRFAERSLERMAGEIARIEKKIALQEDEHDAVRARREATDAPSLTEYISFLLRASR